MVYAKRLSGWHVGGVRLPRSVEVMDCRGEPVKSPWGETLYGSEKAALALGLRQSWSGHDCNPASVSWCVDAQGGDGHAAHYIRSLRGMLAREWREYRRARRNPAKPGKGGSVHYKPVAVTLANFGGSVMADKRLMAVEAFRGD